MYQLFMSRLSLTSEQWSIQRRANQNHSIHARLKDTMKPLTTINSAATQRRALLLLGEEAEGSEASQAQQLVDLVHILHQT